MGKGQILYELYLTVFGTVFAPTYRELTKESQENWSKLADRYEMVIKSEERPQLNQTRRK